MKKCLGLVFLIILSCSSKKNEKLDVNKEKEKVIFEIINLFNKKDIVKINKEYIYSDFGLYELSRIGLKDTLIYHKKIEKKESAKGTIYQLLTSIDKLNQRSNVKTFNPKFDCDNFRWSNSGVFFNNKDLNNTFVIKLNEKRIENNTLKIVDTKSDVIFYLTKINSRYYITLIDTITTDCSA